MSDISIVLGGEERTRKYLDGHTAPQASEMINQDPAETTLPNSPSHRVGSDTQGELQDLTVPGWAPRPQTEEREGGAINEVMDLTLGNEEFLPEDLSMDLANWDMTGLLSDWLNLSANQTETW